MKIRGWGNLCWRLGLAIASVMSGTVATSENCVFAQIAPDRTLGTASSVVTPNVVIKGIPSDRIDGGAIRGTNLFHSLLKFNVVEGRGAYFTNPAGVENILTRVTGSNPSNILGVLGVLGNANLFLLNPNGIVFGPNARLDIRGSFSASTASNLKFADGTQYSATDPQANPLLTVSVPLGLQFGLNQLGSVTNAGNLAVGRDLSLSGGTVISTGQIAAPTGQVVVKAVSGDAQVRELTAQTATLWASHNLTLVDSQLRTTGDLNLLAQNIVQVRDSVANPFIAQAGGSLYLQGNQGIDIFALNHPASVFSSGSDMVMRSANSVGGDAHYTTGGSFRIEALDGSLGNLHSTYDPVVRASGNVSFNSYSGASLHILAGGSVNIPGNVTITGTDTPANSIVENVVLSDGKTVVPINGSTQPTLDIRAGTTAFATPGITGGPNGFSPSTGGSPTGADITVGSITNRGGTVFLTNLYSPNTLLPNGKISVGSIDTANNGNGGNVLVFGKGDINTNGIQTFVGTGINGSGGDITLTSTSGAVNTTGGDINSYGMNKAGNVNISAAGNIATGNISNGSSQQGGNITLTSTQGSVSTNSGTTLYSAGSDNNGNGNAGNLTIVAADNITTNGSIENFGNQKGGDVSFTAGGSINTAKIQNSGQQGGNLTLTSSSGAVNTTGGDIDSFGTNKAGNVNISAAGNIATGNIDNSSSQQGGNITLTSTNGEVNTSKGKLGPTVNQGNAGNVSITAAGNITTADVGPFVGVNGEGNGGDVTLTSVNGAIDTRQGTLFSATPSGNGGNITLTAAGNIFTASVQTFVGGTGTGNGGNIILASKDGAIDTTRGTFFSNTSDGTGGNIALNAFSGISAGQINSFTSTGTAGNIQLSSNQGNIVTSGINSAAFAPNGNAGNILLVADAGSIFLSNVALNTSSTSSNGGNIRLNAQKLVLLRNKSSIEANTGFLFNGSNFTNFGGNGGKITINAGVVILVEGSNIGASANLGNGGNITIAAQGIFRSGDSQINAFSLSGMQGLVEINAAAIDPSRALLPLQSSIRPPQIDEGCRAVRGPSANRFVVTGRGGLPPNPSEPLTSEAVLTADGKALAAQTENLSETNPSTNNAPPASDTIVIAQGWVVGSNGNVFLTAQTPTITPHSPWLQPVSCHGY